MKGPRTLIDGGRGPVEGDDGSGEQVDLPLDVEEHDGRIPARGAGREIGRASCRERV